MIFGIPTKKDWEILEKRRQWLNDFREKILDSFVESYNFAREKGLISESDYWKWRIDFDSKRYGIKK